PSTRRPAGGRGSRARRLPATISGAGELSADRAVLDLAVSYRRERRPQCRPQSTPPAVQAIEPFVRRRSRRRVRAALSCGPPRRADAAARTGGTRPAGARRTRRTGRAAATGAGIAISRSNVSGNRNATGDDAEGGEEFAVSGAAAVERDVGDGHRS